VYTRHSRYGNLSIRPNNRLKGTSGVSTRRGSGLRPSASMAQRVKGGRVVQVRVLSSRQQGGARRTSADAPDRSYCMSHSAPHR